MHTVSRDERSGQLDVQQVRECFDAPGQERCAEAGDDTDQGREKEPATEIIEVEATDKALRPFTQRRDR